MFIGIYTLEESLSVKGYFAACAIFLSMSAFRFEKVIRDNLEDGFESRKRNTSAFTFLAWSSFALALLGMSIGLLIWISCFPSKDIPVTALFLTMFSFVLQKQFVITTMTTRSPCAACTCSVPFK